MILSDAHMRKFNALGNARVIFRQALKQSDLIWHLYILFQSYCSSGPTTERSLINETGNYRESIWFGTRSTMFQVYLFPILSGGCKNYTLKYSRIFNPCYLSLLDNRCASQGGWTGYGLIMYTNSYTLTQVELL